MASHRAGPRSDRIGSRIPWNRLARATTLAPGAASAPATGETLPSKPTTTTRAGISWAQASAYGPPPGEPGRHELVMAEMINDLGRVVSPLPDASVAVID